MYGGMQDEEKTDCSAHLVHLQRAGVAEGEGLLGFKLKDEVLRDDG